MNVKQSIQRYTPGVLLLIVIALLARGASFLVPSISGVLFAIVIGMVFQAFLPHKEYYGHGISFTLKKLLKLAIVLLGSTLSISAALSIGKDAIIGILMVVFLGISVTLLIGKLLKIDLILSILIGVGTSICGATAITATKSVIDARQSQTAYAISTIFLFNLLSIFFYPWIGHLLSLSESTYGIWVGTAIHDMSSAVAIGYAYGDEAGEVSTTVKLVRTLFLIPIMVVLSLWFSKKDCSQADKTIGKKIIAVFPWFLLAFIAMSILTSIGMFSNEMIDFNKGIAKFIILMVMAAVGLQVQWKNFKALGLKPLLTGFLASIIVSFTSFMFVYYFIV